MPDHGTSGLSFGDGAYKDYASKGLDSAYMNISKVRRTASGLEKILLKARPEQIPPLFREYTGIELTDDELALLRSSRNYTEADYMKVANSVNMVSSIGPHRDLPHPFRVPQRQPYRPKTSFWRLTTRRATCPWGAIPIRRFNAYMADLLVWSVRWLN